MHHRLPNQGEKKEMWLTTKQPLSAISAHHHYSSTSSSPSGALSESSDGDTSSGSDSYSYYSEGFGSYRSASSVLTSSWVATTTIAGTTTSTFSAVYSSSTNAFSDALTPTSVDSYPLVPTSCAVTRSAVSRRDAVGDNAAIGASGLAVFNHHNKQVAAALARQTDSAAMAITTFNGVLVRNTGALVCTRRSRSGSPSPLSGTVAAAAAVAPGKSSMSLVALSPVSNRAAVSPYYSEDEQVRHLWTPVDCDAIAHTRKKRSGRGRLALSVLDSIRTVPIAVPPRPEEVQRQGEEDSLPCPSHLMFRSAPSPSPVRRSDSAVAEEKDGKGKGDREERAEVHAATAAHARKTSFISCGFFHCCREKAPRKTDSRAVMRQRSHYHLRSHHVPLVNFRTTCEHGSPMEGVRNVLPRVEETVGYRSLEDNMMGTEASLKKLQKGMQPRDRTTSSLHLKMSYALDHRADGGPDGAGQSAFMRNGDPQSFWMVQLHERASLRLEPVEIEAYSST
ncbi:hypothetical protein, conserved [Leishmania lindenbergi]|uniref:Uncharacterized protein n=1 Tax=Leishmania lindenbergi TaxID=651832 RepID=A0AAW3AWP2_9TRYP